MKNIVQLLSNTLAFLAFVSVWGAPRAASHYVMPTFQGKTAEEWFYGDMGNPALESTITNAQTAFNVMGTNCVPFLAQKAGQRDAQFAAFWHLRFLTSEAQFMAEPILNIVGSIDDNHTRREAFESVEPLAEGLMDTGKKKAYFVSFLDDPDDWIQLKAAIALSTVDAKFTNGVPVLLKAVTSKDFVEQSFAAQFSSHFRPFFLAGLVRDMQKSAYAALKKVSPEKARQIPFVEQTPEEKWRERRRLYIF